MMKKLLTKLALKYLKKHAPNAISLSSHIFYQGTEYEVSSITMTRGALEIQAINKDCVEIDYYYDV